MAIVSRTSAKAYFETGDKPTQSQFGDFIDSALFYEDTSDFGRSLVSASSAISARSLLGGGNVGSNLFTVITTASGQTQLGGGIVGRQIFEAITTASGRNALDAQPLNTNLSAFANLSGSENKIPYFTGAGAMALFDRTVIVGRNLLINGGMAIDQRNSGAAQTITAGAALAYTIDRWYAYCTGANATGQRVAGTAPNQFNYRFTGAASVSKIGFAQRIEAANSQHLAGRTATLSVDLANSLLTTATWTAWYANSTDSFGTLASPTRTQIATGTFTITSTLTRYSTSISIPLAATTGIEIEFSVGSQTSGTWTIGRVQLEDSPDQTTFEVRPIQQELTLCFRYLERIGGQLTNEQICTGASSSTTSANGVVRFSTEKRAIPTISMPSGNQFRFNNGSNNYVSTASSASGISTKSFLFALTISGATANTGGLIDSFANTGIITIESEL